MNRKVLFVHDGPIHQDSKGNYYGNNLNHPLQDRYLKLGSHVTLLMRVDKLCDQDVERLTRIENNNYSVEPIPNYKSINLFVKNYYKARAIIKREVSKHDIVVCRLPSAAGTEAAKWALRIEKPLLVEYVGCTFDAYWHYDLRGKLIAHYKMWQQKRLIQKVPYTIYVTHEYLQKRYPTANPSLSCSNVDIGRIEIANLQNRLLKIEQLGDKPQLTLGTIARLDVPYKGQADVIKALARLKEKGIMFNYQLVGQGSPDRLLKIADKAGVVEQLQIIGSLKRVEIFEFLKGLDIYIQPSRTEGLPRVVIEAMSVGCPALGSRVGGIPELLDENMMFGPGNIQEISEKLISFNKETLKSQAARNWEIAKDYESEELNKKRQEFYEKFLYEAYG